VDLVRLQIASAEADWFMGWSDPPVGHAIEVRLYAEDPAADYQPQSGRLTRFDILPEGVQSEDGIRVDAGFETGSEVSTHYDAMLAKVIAHAPTREAAARKLASVLSRARIHGVVTNRDLLVAALRDAAFLRGDVSTAFDFERTFDHDDPGAPVAAAIALAERASEARTVQRGIPVAWRNVVSQPQRTVFEGATVEWLATGGSTSGAATPWTATPWSPRPRRA
jgi:propionyl-CoA carboxylase alpha chain